MFEIWIPCANNPVPTSIFKFLTSLITWQITENQRQAFLI